MRVSFLETNRYRDSERFRKARTMLLINRLFLPWKMWFYKCVALIFALLVYRTFSPLKYLPWQPKDIRLHDKSVENSFFFSQLRSLIFVDKKQANYSSLHVCAKTKSRRCPINKFRRDIRIVNVSLHILNFTALVLGSCKVDAVSARVYDRRV